MKRINSKIYQDNLNKIYNNRYLLLTKNLNSISQKVEIYDKKCKKSFFISSANEFTRKRVQERYKQFCPCCKPDKNRSQYDLQQEIDFLTNKKIKIIECNKNMHFKSKLQCKKCGNIWEAPLHSLINNIKNHSSKISFGCPFCSHKRKKNTEIFKQELFEKYKNKFRVLGEYVNTNTPIEIQCNKCNNIFYPRPVDILYKTQCPYCNQFIKESKATKFIKKLLISYKIDFEQEVEFEECKYKKYLPFDFYIKTGKKFILIEYDGAQHFRGWNGNTDRLDDIKRSDSIKNEFCIKYRIPLLRLNYLDNYNDISNKILDFLSENGLISKKKISSQ